MINETSAGGDLASAALLFNWVEYLVFCTMLVLSLLIGVYYGWFKEQSTVAEYMLGGKKMGVFPVTLSLVFSHTSGVTLLGIPAEIYAYGTQYLSIVVCNFLFYFVVNYLYLPVFFELQSNSLYEYLELRFSKATRTLTSLIFAIGLIAFIPVVIYIPALAFNQVTGVSVHVITPIVCFICIFYTLFGGLKAVVWTDALQSIFTLGSIIFVVVLGYIKIGSVSQVFKINDDGHRLELFNMSPSLFEGNTFLAFSLGEFFFWGANLAVHPGAVQRFIAVPTLRDAKLVMLWSCVIFFVIKILVINVGMLLYAAYHDCDPVATKMVKKVGQVLPLYVMDVARDFQGLTGLFISGVLSAALSTMSASLNTVAGTIYEDFLQLFFKDKKLSDKQHNLVIKVIVLVLGLVCVALVFLVEKLGTLFQVGQAMESVMFSTADVSDALQLPLLFNYNNQNSIGNMTMTLAGLTYGTLFGVFSLGLFCPRANAKGAIWGSAVSLMVMTVLVVGSQYYTTQGLLKIPGKVTSVDGCPPELIAALPFNASTRVQTYCGVGSPPVADDSVPLLFQLSYMYYSLVGFLLVFLVALPVSYCTEEPSPSCLDPRLFAPPFRRFLPKGVKDSKTLEEYTLVRTSEPNGDLKISPPGNQKP